MSRAENLIRRADGWVFAPEDARRLAAVRIGLCSLLAVRLAITDYRVVAALPGRYQPVFYMKLFDRMPSPEIATSLKICGIVAALVAATGFALRASLPLAFVCSLVLHGILNSAGRVIVGDAVLTLCLLVLLACGDAASEAWSIHGPVQRAALRWVRRGPVSTTPAAPKPPSTGQRYGWPIRTARIAIALAYFFAGFQKLRHSGLPWVTSDNLRWILYASSDSHAHPNALALFIADRPSLAHLFAAGSLLLETLFPLVLFFPRLRWLFIPGVVAMHLGIRLAMGLDYSAQWLTALIVFINWPVIVNWVRRVEAPVRAPGNTFR